MPTEIKLTLTGYRVEDALPNASEYYGVIDRIGDSLHFNTFMYSALHEKFNAIDRPGGDSHALEVEYWFELPGTIAEIEKGAAHHD